MVCLSVLSKKIFCSTFKPAVLVFKYIRSVRVFSLSVVVVLSVLISVRFNDIMIIFVNFFAYVSKSYLIKKTQPFVENFYNCVH